MNCAVIHEHDAGAISGQRLAVELRRGHAPARAAGILDVNVVTRGAIPECHREARPRFRYAGIEQERLAL